MENILSKIAKLILIFLVATACRPEGKHLFILSGQSNMEGLIPEESFIPKVEAEFGAENVIVVKSAYGGQPIRRWFKDWKDPLEMGIQAQPDLYDTLLSKVNSAIIGQKIQTITLVWMQGERDAREGHADEYERSLVGLHGQLVEDLDFENINFVIGRLSDFDLENARYPHWTRIRDIQVQVAQSNGKFAWVDTDDLNDGLNRQGKEIQNDLHLSAQGYYILGERFAESAIHLIRSN
ncbi:sialate O-acetylesterase [Algoriphagus namhaensis]|uniref:Sialate O-acetylesterase n=1 Tax=Algoriphagus namhaensis TaxID=915353 RepID=A0ABV8ASV4_9BACT